MTGFKAIQEIQLQHFHPMGSPRTPKSSIFLWEYYDPVNVVLKVVVIENAGGWESGNAHPILLKVGWDEHFPDSHPPYFLWTLCYRTNGFLAYFFEFPGLL